MAASLIKLVMNATTTTRARPTTKRYVYKYNTNQKSGVKIVIPSTSFITDAGTNVIGNFTTITASNGYYLLFINGVLQESALYTIGTAGSRVTVLSGGATLKTSAPITLVVNNFDPLSTSTVTS